MIPGHLPDVIIYHIQPAVAYIGNIHKIVNYRCDHRCRSHSQIVRLRLCLPEDLGVGTVYGFLYYLDGSIRIIDHDFPLYCLNRI